MSVIKPTELRQVFRAYAKQLRSDYQKADQDKLIKSTRARGFETVQISDEARTLAAEQKPAKESRPARGEDELRREEELERSEEEQTEQTEKPAPSEPET